MIGTGASAIQFVPQIVDRVEDLYLFQRTPPWIVPKIDWPIPASLRWCFRNLPFTRYLFRSFIYWRQEFRGIGFTIDPRLMKKARKIALDHLEASVADESLRKKLTPDYTIGCKRILISNDYYPALQKDNLELVTDAVQSVDSTGITDVTGRHFEVDAIIFGTGFHATDPLTPMRIFGEHGRELGQDWAAGPEAYFGISVNGYPNLFLLMGPNTGLGHNSMVFMIESQVAYVVKLLKAMRSTGVSTARVKRDVQTAYNDKLATMLAKTVWSSGCKSWYQTDDGKQAVLWPGSTVSYWRKTRRPELRHYDFQ